MNAPAGPCEWCGGPQLWTVVRGEMWVSCKRGCLPLPFEGEVLDCSAGSTIDPERVDSPGGVQYLTREGREAEARLIDCVGSYGAPD